MVKLYMFCFSSDFIFVLMTKINQVLIQDDVFNRVSQDAGYWILGPLCLVFVFPVVIGCLLKL